MEEISSTSLTFSAICIERRNERTQAASATVQSITSATCAAMPSLIVVANLVTASV